MMFNLVLRRAKFTYVRQDDGLFDIYLLANRFSKKHRIMATCEIETDAIDIVTALTFAYDSKVI